jgi:hypothetical protein
MNNALRVAATALWVVVATVALAWVWGGNLDAVPRPPVSFANWLSDLYGAKDAEDVGRLDVIYMLTVSFIVVVVGTFAARWLWKRRKA